MLPLEIIVRVEPGAGSAFGSGILIGQHHVLTCAHVVDPDYAKANYLDQGIPAHAKLNINDRPGYNAELKDRFACRSVNVVAYDGISRKANLVAVHDHHDLVLLRLSAPVRHPVSVPPLQTDFQATKASDTAGLGFRRTQAESYSIWAEKLELISSDSERFAMRSTVLNGQATEGMSGGPVIAHFADGQLKIIGMLTMGGSTQATCGMIRADALARFLKSHLGEADKNAQPDAGYGLNPQLAVPNVEPQMMAAFWIPLPKTQIAGDFDGYIYDRIRYIASRPLTFADIDAVTGYQAKGQMSTERAHFFAPMSIIEAQEITRLLSEKLGERFSVPDFATLNKLPSPLPADASKTETKDHARPELVLAPEWDARRCPQRGSAFFPAAGAPEWTQDAGKGHIAFLDPERSGWDNGPLAQANYKALLRPMLTIPVWATGR